MLFCRLSSIRPKKNPQENKLKNDTNQPPCITTIECQPENESKKYDL